MVLGGFVVVVVAAVLDLDVVVKLVFVVEVVFGLVLVDVCLTVVEVAVTEKVVEALVVDTFEVEVWAVVELREQLPI